MGLIAVGVLPWLDRNNTLARTIAIGACAAVWAGAT